MPLISSIRLETLRARTGLPISLGLLEAWDFLPTQVAPPSSVITPWNLGPSSCTVGAKREQREVQTIMIINRGGDSVLGISITEGLSLSTAVRPVETKLQDLGHPLGSRTDLWCP